MSPWNKSRPTLSLPGNARPTRLMLKYEYLIRVVDSARKRDGKTLTNMQMDHDENLSTNI